MPYGAIAVDTIGLNLVPLKSVIKFLLSRTVGVQAREDIKLKHHTLLWKIRKVKVRIIAFIKYDKNQCDLHCPAIELVVHADYLHLVITLSNPSLALTEKVLYKTYSPEQETP